jgi:uncharacterized protein Yka (UPF0111/DUF47 family)
MDAYHILVIVLASFLGLFLLLAVIIAVLVIKIVRSVKKITDRAERAAHSVGTAADFIKHAASPMTIGKVIGTIVNVVRSSSKDTK